MKSIVFDTGPVISLTTNNLLWLLKEMRMKYGGEFYIPRSVKKELVDRPLAGKAYKFEAIQVLELIHTDVIKITGNDQILRKTKELLDLANTLFKARGNWLTLVHFAEIETVATALLFNSEAIVIDERTTRTLIESPLALKDHLQSKLHTKIQVNQKNLKRFVSIVKDIKIIRSVELVALAYEQGMLNRYIVPKEEKEYPDIHHQLLESVLWGMKIKGCAVTSSEIYEIMRLIK